MRTFLRLLIALVTMATLTVSAQADIPSGVIVNNGFIAIHNDSSRRISVQVYHEWPGIASLAMIDGWTTINPHSVYYANSCCYAAGSWYSIVTNHDGANRRWSVHARLCHKGVPYGYAVVVLKIMSGKPRNGDDYVDLHQLDAPCP
ncbi:MAG: hypothetical protein KGN02_05610 [bacterium]|nr:hypothetical protein [bacterium]